MANGRKEGKSLGEIFTRDFIIIATINLAMFFGFQMTNVGIPVYMAQLGAGAQIVGLAATLMTITATVVRVFAGPMLDRFGRTGMLVGGIAVMLCSLISYAVFPIVGVIIGLRLVQGVGWGAGSTASSTIAADIIPKRRFAEGMGYFAMTNALSSALAPAVAVELASGAGGGVMACVAAAITALSFVLAIVEALLGRRERKTAVDSAASAGPVSADAPASPAVPGASAAAAGPGAPAAPASPASPERLSSTGFGGAPARSDVPASKFDMLFERRAIVPGALILLVNIGFGCITTFIALHAIERGVPTITPYFVVYAIVTLLSRPFIGRLIDLYGYRLPAILSTLCTAATLVLIGMAGDVAAFAGAGVLGGLGLGTAMGTYQAMAVASVEPRRRGVATSTYMTAFDLGIAIGSLLGGVFAGAFGYELMYYASAVFPLAACALSFIAVKK